MIEQSSSIKELATALLKAQEELGAVQENATNPFFKSKYADLGEHIKTIKPAFQKHGLVITQFLTGNENKMGVTTMLMHTSGEWLKSTAIIPLEEEKGNSKAQTAGKAISYLRRYALAAVANVYSGEDNDGNIEQPKKSQPKKEQPKKEQNGSQQKKLEAIGVEAERPYEPDVLKEKVSGFAAIYRNNQERCTDTDRKIVAASIDGIFEKDTTKRYELCKWLTGHASTKDMGAEYINACKKWLGVNSWGDEVNPDAQKEAIKALPVALKSAGQMEMI